MKKAESFKRICLIAGILLGTWPSLMRAQRRSAPVISPEILEDHSVIFRLNAPDANTVRLAGTMNADYAELDMVRNDSGLYEIKVGPLDPDIYVYTFKVDGITTLDPANNIVMRDGSYIESRLMVPGGLTDLHDVHEVPHGRVSDPAYLESLPGSPAGMQISSTRGYSIF
jgi:hypothetical protein